MKCPECNADVAKKHERDLHNFQCKACFEFLICRESFNTQAGKHELRFEVDHDARSDEILRDAEEAMGIPYGTLDVCMGGQN